VASSHRDAAARHPHAARAQEAQVAPPIPIDSAKAAFDEAKSLCSADGGKLWRDAKRRQTLAENRRKFVNGPVLTLAFRHMNVQFNPQNLQPFGQAGTVYPTIRVVDDWGSDRG